MKQETILAAKIIGAFRTLGAKCLRLHSGKVRVRGGWMHQNEEGTADWMILFPGGISRFVEIKVPGETPKPKQLEWRSDVERLGFVCDTVTTLEEALAVAREARKGKR